MLTDTVGNRLISQDHFGNSYITLLSPGTGAQHYIEGSIRNPIYSELIKNVNQWPQDKIDKFYDIISDFMALHTHIEDYDLVLEELGDKILNLSGEFADVAAIRSIFTKLEPQHRIHIMYESVANLKTNLTNELDANYNFYMKYRNDPNLSQKIHIEGLYLHFMLRFCKTALKYGHGAKMIKLKGTKYESKISPNKDVAKFSKYHSLTSLFLLRFVAYSKNKLSADEILDDISEYSGLLPRGLEYGDEIFDI
ncbi:hypothetical protein HNP89_000963 [Methanococcus maripaludis]|uniref:Uncharacterized protein n=1 Tax=Methanococcus maripaludis TaxID=39152 RepID=A0A7J9P4L7_METMI|nr:hypothetical protein [Methanococcus maripaludis]MBA2853006.1 hypothetical protein [Methanococcus maripaludis]